MAKMELIASDITRTIHALKLFRSGWANDIRESWHNHMEGSQEISFALYEISGSIILSLQDVLAGRFRDKMALFLVKKKLEELVTSENFKFFDECGKAHICGVVTSGTKQHIRIILETLEVLTA